jgi:hypothetical protein
MIGAPRTFRVFVSSTFADMSAERDALQRRVFPRLRRLCESRGFRFHAVDLRWGIAEEAGIDQQTMRVCAQEIARCQDTDLRPNFMLLLGDRYGWRPLPWAIPEEDFKALSAWMSTHDLDLAREWYRRDENALPRPLYLLQPRIGVWRDRAQWAPVEHRMQQAFAQAAEKVGFDARRRLQYEASATEQEIVLGALEVPKAREHVHAFIRTIDDDVSARPPDAAHFIDLDGDGNDGVVSRAAQQSLKQSVEAALEGRVDQFRCRWAATGVTQDHLWRFCATVYARLAGVIRAETARLNTVSPLTRELEAQRRFADSRLVGFLGRADLLAEVSAYLQSSEPAPLFVRGEQGSGKSSVMAKASRDAAAQLGLHVLSRFIGITPGSSTGLALLQSLNDELTTGNASPSVETTDFLALTKIFSVQLTKAAEDKGVVLFLDALDQLPTEDPARRLSWLPNPLPPNVRVIISALPDFPLAPVTVRGGMVRDLGVLSLDEADEILAHWLRGAARTLNAAQRECVLSGFAGCPLPLYLKFAFEVVRHWESFHSADPLPADLEAMARTLFERLSLPREHGPAIVRRSFALISAARYGLSEEEILGLLSADHSVMTELRQRSPRSPETDSLPPIVWSRLRFDLDNYLMEGSAGAATVLSFFHRVLPEATREYCFASEEDLSRTHRDIARYFRRQPLLHAGADRWPNARKLSEQVFHEIQAGAIRRAAGNLTHFGFVEACCRAGLLRNLMDDCRRALLRWPGYRPFDAMAPQPGEDCAWMADCVEAAIAGTKDPHPQAGAGPLLAALQGLSQAQRRTVAATPKYDNKSTIPEALFESGGAGDAALREARETQANQVRRVDVYGDLSPAGQLAAMLAFLSTHAHLISRTPADVPALARNHSQTGPVAESAAKWLAAEKLPWIAREPRPPQPPTRPLLLAELDHHRDIVLSLAADRDARHAVSAGGWETREPPTPWMDRAKGRVYNPFTFGTADHDARLWDLVQSDVIEVLRGHLSSVWEVALSADGSTAVTASHDGSMRVWDAQVGTLRRSLKYSTPELRHGTYPSARGCLTLSTDGRLLATIPATGDSIDLWDTGDLDLLRRLKVPRGSARALYRTHARREGARCRD